MHINIENNYSDIIVEDYETVIAHVVEAALDEEYCPYEAEVYILLTDNEEIHTINKEHRGIDRPTDVLSFPLFQYKTPACFDEAEEEMDAFHPATGELMLGDILISMDKVKEQAMEYGHSTRRELAFLVAHSMLHLMGYDHMIDEERKVMEEKQRIILEMCGYDRSC